MDETLCFTHNIRVFRHKILGREWMKCSVLLTIFVFQHKILGREWMKCSVRLTIFVLQHKILSREWMKCSVLLTIFVFQHKIYTDVYTIMHILQIALPLFKQDIKVQFVQSRLLRY